MNNFEYRTPPPEISALIDAPGSSAISLSPDLQVAAVFEPLPYQSLEDSPAIEMQLAGLSIDADAFAPTQTGICVKQLRFIPLREPGEGKLIDFSIKCNRVISFKWSPDSNYVALALAHCGGVDLVIADVNEGTLRTLVESRLNSVYGAPFHWSPDGKSLIVKMGLELKKKMPGLDASPYPYVYESINVQSPARAYPDALRSPADADNLEYFLMSQLCEVTIGGARRDIGEPLMIIETQPSPDGKYLIMQRIERPFSYHLLINRFPQRFEIQDLTGKVVREIGCQPLDENRPIGRDAAQKGILEAGWRPDYPSTAYWVETLDGGDFRIQTEERARIHQWVVGSVESPQTIITLGYRFKGIWWSPEGYGLVSEEWWKNRRKRLWLIYPERMGKETSMVFDYSSEDRYSDPGFPLLIKTPLGSVLIASTSNGEGLYLTGAGASDEGERPFLDLLNIPTLQTERLWQSESPYYEKPLAVIGEKDTVLVTVRESQQEPPNLYLRNLGSQKITPLTDYPHPYPGLLGITKEIVTYEREDGLNLNAELFLPAEYDQRIEPLPVLVWAYPREFKNSDSAGQVSGSPNRFSTLNWGSPLYWLARNFVILAGPSMPIIGEGSREPNDAYLEQLVMNARAAVNYLVCRGIADPGRIAIGGQSYGAFMAVNLLAHTDLFCAGIARNGAYNRTLTPFGFQYEERNLWEAKETYFAMSPYLYAEKIAAPLLIIHGKEDTNPGTNPIQSDFLYQALKGLGKTARFVLFPKEGHRFRYRESIMHMAWEIDQWLARYTQEI